MSEIFRDINYRNRAMNLIMLRVCLNLYLYLSKRDASHLSFIYIYEGYETLDGVVTS